MKCHISAWLCQVSSNRSVFTVQATWFRQDNSSSSSGFPKMLRKSLKMEWPVIWASRMHASWAHTAVSPCFHSQLARLSQIVLSVVLNVTHACLRYIYLSKGNEIQEKCILKWTNGGWGLGLDGQSRSFQIPVHMFCSLYQFLPQSVLCVYAVLTWFSLASTVT